MHYLRSFAGQVQIQKQTISIGSEANESQQTSNQSITRRKPLQFPPSIERVQRKSAETIPTPFITQSEAKFQRMDDKRNSHSQEVLKCANIPTMDKDKISKDSERILKDRIEQVPHASNMKLRKVKLTSLVSKEKKGDQDLNKVRQGQLIEFERENSLIKDLLRDQFDDETVQDIIKNERANLRPQNVKTSQTGSSFDLKKVNYSNQLNKSSLRVTQQLSMDRDQPQERSILVKSSQKIFQTALKKVQHSRAIKYLVKEPEDPQTVESDLYSKYRLGREHISKINKKEFYDCLKKIDRLDMYKDLFKQDDNIYVSLIKKVITANKIPKAYPVLKKEELWLSHFDYKGGGSKNIQDIIQILQTPQCQRISSMDLSYNQMTFDLIQQTLGFTPKTLFHLTLNRCNIDLQGMDVLTQYLSQHIVVKSLSLDGNKFGDLGCIKLMDCLTDNHKICSLHLSENRLTSLSCDSISNYLKRSLQIKELYLRFNQINQRGGQTLFKTLQKQKTLKVLDFSHNILGDQNCFYQVTQPNSLKVLDKRQLIDQSECLQQITRFISKPTEIVHLDLSYNKFTQAEALEIQKAFNQNNTIYGFHFEGNASDIYVDSFGLLCTLNQEKQKKQNTIAKAQRYQQLRFTNEQLLVEEDYESSTQLPTELPFDKSYRQRQIMGVNKIHQNQQFKTVGCLDTCWICEDYQEIDITWETGNSGAMSTSPIFVHLNIYNWEPMIMNEINKSFIRYIMVPPDTLIEYFFTNPIQRVYTVAKNQLTMDIPNDHRLQKPLAIVYDGQVIMDLPQLKKINYVHSQQDMKVVDDSQGYIVKIFSKPREVQEPFDFAPYLGNMARGWQIGRSFFGNYRVDNKTFLQKCFKVDFDSSKISKIVRDESNFVKDLLFEYYPYIFLAYKLFASFGSLTNLPSISLSVFYEFLANTRIMDGKLRNTDIDVMFVSSNGKDQNYPNIVDRAIVRYQLLELCVRIAMDKYYKSGIVQSAAQALVKLFEEDGIVEWLKEYDSGQEWRDFRYWNESTDILINQSLPFLKCLFKYTAQLNPKNKYYNFVWVSSIDFKDLIVSLGVIGEHLSEREVYLAFLQSMMTQVDELYSNRHQQMSLHEFVEALARIAEKLSILLPLAVEKPEDIIRLTYHERILYDLPRKFKGFLMTIYFKISDQMKETLKSQADDDYYKIDSCMMSERDTQSKTPTRKTFVETQNLTSESEEDSYNDSFASSESEKSLILQEKKSFLLEQIKDYSKKKEVRTKIQGSQKDNFTFATFVKYLNHHQNQNI